MNLEPIKARLAGYWEGRETDQGPPIADFMLHAPTDIAELVAEVERLQAVNEERCIVRPDSEGFLDDVVIDNVSMFRMERMYANSWWFACYFGEDRICFLAHYSKKDGIVITVSEEPTTRVIVGDTHKHKEEA